jgi:hypothetical protein
MTTIDKTKTAAKPPSMIAWHVREGKERGYWTRIGAAWDHDDGDGLNIKLDVFPLDGRIVLRVPKADDGNGDQGGDAA